MGKTATRSTDPQFRLCAFGSVTMAVATRWLIHSMIPAEGLVAIYGPPKSAKSFLTFDMLMHVALGWEYRGRRVTQGSIVYAALEGHHGFSARVEAFRQQRLAEDHAPVPFYLMTTPIALANDVGEFIDSIRAQMPEGERPAAVVIDTLNRAFIGSENDDAAMGGFIRAAGRIVNELSCTVIVVHHSGIAGDRPRGHTSFGGALDALFSVKKAADGLITLSNEWMKDGREGDALTSRLKVVEVGRDDEGDAITSCVVTAVGEGGGLGGEGKKARKLSEKGALALEALREALDSHGRPAPGSLEIPAGTRVVPPAAWMEELFRRGILDPEASGRREQFRRIKVDLMARHAVAERDQLLWLTL